MKYLDDEVNQLDIQIRTDEGRDRNYGLGEGNVKIEARKPATIERIAMMPIPIHLRIYQSECM